MVSFGLLVLAAFTPYQEYSMGRPLKEDDSFVMQTLTSIQAGDSKVVTDGKFEHQCTDVDENGIQHIQATCIEGTVRRGSGDPESMKGEYYNYYLNTHGVQFDYEDIRPSWKENPIAVIESELHWTLKVHTVVAEETWTDKSAYTQYKITVGKPKQFMKCECIEVVRKGDFTNGITGTFKEDSWYRTSDGQLMYRETTADDVSSADIGTIQYLERTEFVSSKY